MGLLIREQSVNVTEGYHCEDSGVYESRFETVKEAYPELVKLFGRCTGKVYKERDNYSEHSVPVGYIFAKRVSYDDCKDTFLCETWVTFHTDYPQTTVTYHPLEI